ncbi:MAG: ABC transporter permease [Desulfovibrionaceae bacterium]
MIQNEYTISSTKHSSIMQYYTIFTMSIKAILAYQLRSIFIIIAVSLGIASLTIILAAIRGAHNKAEEIVSAFGSDALLLFGGNIKQTGFNFSADTLTQKDINWIRESIPNILSILPMRTRNAVQTKYKNNSYTVATVTGSTEEYNHSWRWDIAKGRPFDKTDITRGLPVAIIGDTLKEKLFPNSDPVGKQFFINNTLFTVIGVLDKRSAGGLYDVNDTVIIPITTLMQRFDVSKNRYDSVRLLFKNSDVINTHIGSIRALLRENHTRKINEEDDFTIVSPTEVLSFVSFIKGGISVFLLIAALGTLIISGFVLANLYYIAVVERKSEIGLKKALGATKNHIIFQFLSESIILTCIGALLGIGFGVGAGYFLEKLHIITIDISLTVFLYSFAAAIVLGILFGLNPARQASSINPISALKGNE